MNEASMVKLPYFGIPCYYRFVQLNRYWSTAITHAWLEVYKPQYTDSYKNKQFEN